MAGRKKPPKTAGAIGPTPSLQFDPTGRPVDAPTEVDKRPADVVGRDGKLYEIPREQLAQAIEQGYREPDADDYVRHERDKVLDDPVLKASAFAAGALDSVSVGGSTAAISGMYGEDGREALRQFKENEHTRNWYTGGQLAGMVQPYGPANIAGKGAGLAAARLLGNGAGSFLARAAQRATAGALQAGTEMAVLEAGNEITEDILGDREITSEKLLHAVGRGLYSGAPLGAAVGAGSAAIETLGLRTAGKIGERADDLADTMRSRQAGARVGDYRKAGRTAEEIREEQSKIARTLEETTVETPQGVKRLADSTSFEDISNWVAPEVRKSGEAVANAFSEATKRGLRFDGAPLFEKFNAAKLIDDVSVERKVMEPFGSGYREVTKRVAIPGLENDFAAITDYQKKLRGVAQGATFDEAWRLRRGLDDILDGFYNRAKDTTTTSASERSFVKMRKMFDDELMEQLKGKLGPLDRSTLDKALAAKQQYGTLKQVQQWSTREYARAETASNVRLRDYLAGGVFTSIGAHTGVAVGGPVGGAIGAGLGSLTGGALNRYANEHASRHVADFARKVGKLKELQSKTSGYTRSLEQKIQQFVDRGTVHTATAVSAASRFRKEDFPKIADHIQTMAASPEKVAEHVGKVIPPAIREAAPMVTAGMVTKAHSDFQFLNSVLPRGPAGTNYLQRGLARGFMPADSQIRKFFRYMEAIDDTPQKVLDLAIEGKLHREAVEVLKKTSPHHYEFIRAGLMDAVGRSRRRLSSQQKTALNLIYGIAVDATQERAFVQMAQSAHEPSFLADSSQEASAGAAVASPPSRPVDGLSEPLMTATDQIMT